MKRTIWHFLTDTNGATAIEYAVLAAGIAGVIIATITTLGGKVNSTYTTVNSNM